MKERAMFLEQSLQNKQKDTMVSFFYLITSILTIINTEMVESMKSVAQLNTTLSVEERNLLSVAYKNVIGSRRASWRIISSIEQKEESKGDSDKLEMIRAYRIEVETELKKITGDVLSLLDDHLLKASDNGDESLVFYNKMYVVLIYIELK